MTTISMDQEGASETNTSFDLIVGLCNFGLCHVVDDIIDYLDTRYDQYSTFPIKCIKQTADELCRAARRYDSEFALENVEFKKLRLKQWKLR